MTQALKFHRTAVITLVLFAFFMSGLVSRTVFERLPHLEDEVAYLFQARIFARGDAVIATPQPQRAFWQPFVVDYPQTGNRFGKYTPGWPAVLSLGINLGQEWVINAFLAAMTVALTFHLGSKLFNEDVGLIAAALTAFSPMALLLNGTLMGHTAALFFATLFVFAYRRIELERSPILWGIVAGIALGLMAITRPLTAVGIALPFIVWSGANVLHRLLNDPSRLGILLLPLIALSVCALALTATIPLFNQAATGDASQNLYELVWDYDRIGFGECCGRSGHNLERAVRHARFDLSLTAADLFGWQLGEITPALQSHLQTESDYWPEIGLSFILFPIGAFIGLMAGAGDRWRRRILLTGLWTAFAVFWVVLPLIVSTATLRNLDFAKFWIAGALLWLMFPLILFAWLPERETARWTWLLMALVLGLLVVQMTYWIGSQRYSTRYYFEALTGAALISAIPLAWLARGGLTRFLRNLLQKREGTLSVHPAWTWAVYAVLCVVLLHSLYNYSTPRIEALRGFNYISQADIDAVEARRDGDRPVLVIISGPASGDDRVRWRALGSLMVVTSPYLDSHIVGAWDYADGVREALLERFPDRQIIYMAATGNEARFVDELPTDSG